MNVIARLDFKLTYFETTVQHFSHFIVAAIISNKVSHNRPIVIMNRVFANGPEELGSIPGQVIPKTQKMVLDASLLNTQHYKVRIKVKVEQYREISSGPYILV